MSITCPLECGREEPLLARESAGVTVFVCPDCLGVALDGGVLCDPRKPVDLSRALKPIITAVSTEHSIDPLTQVKNQRFFFHRLGVELKAASHRHFVSVAAFVIDLENLYRAGGSRGGDFVLQAVAASLLAEVRVGDNFARVEADTFGLILPHADEARAEEIADRVMETVAIRDYHTHMEKSLKVGIRHAVFAAGAGDTPEQAWQRLMTRLERHGEKR